MVTVPISSLEYLSISNFAEVLVVISVTSVSLAPFLKATVAEE